MELLRAFISLYKHRGFEFLGGLLLSSELRPKMGGFGGLAEVRGLGLTSTPQVPFNRAFMALNSGYLGYDRG